ncbi:MAG: DUF4389 domain-containing protein [Arachnia sp.]
MSSTIPHTFPPTGSPPRGPTPGGSAPPPTRTMLPGHVIALVLGCLMLIPGLGLLVGGGSLAIAYGMGTGGGYIQESPIGLNTRTAALTAGDLVVINDMQSPSWLVDALKADIRLTVTPAPDNGPIFVGIGESGDVNAYLASIAHEQIVGYRDGTPITTTKPGNATAPPPATQDIWSTQATGVGAQELNWTVTDGSDSIVVMNADGSPGVNATATAGLRAGIVLPLALTLLGVGLLMTAGGVVLIAWASRRRPGLYDTSSTALDAAPAGAVNPFTAGYPVALTAHLDPQLSRWQWLIKWFLAIPHLLVLVVLWPVFVVLTMIAGVAILFTGRYPRALFDVNLSILRYSWRVSYYATHGGIGTDRYPPFSGGPVPDYPATLNIAYPERLSRGLVLVKWWLLALPHYLVVALLIGSVAYQTALRDYWFGGNHLSGVLTTGGLLGLLVVVAGVLLLITGAYPRGLFALIIGCNRWIYRVIAYAALMTDHYPPFRLDQGGSEPVRPMVPTGPTLPPTDAATDDSEVRIPELVSHGG